MISNSPSSPTQCWFVEINNCQIQEPYSRIIPSEAPTLNSGGKGFIFDSGYNFFAVSFKKCLPGDYLQTTVSTTFDQDCSTEKYPTFKISEYMGTIPSIFHKP